MLLRITRERAAFPTVCALLNFAFVWWFFGIVPAVLLFALTAFGYGLMRLATSQGGRAAAAGVVLLCLVFVELKHYPFALRFPALTRIPAIVGLSYLIFRLIHLTVDGADRQLPELNLAKVFAYSLFWPTLLSGPIMRYQDFESSVTRDEPRMSDLARTALGYFKVMAIAPAILSLHAFFIRKSATPVQAGIDLRLVFAHAEPATLGAWIWMIGTVAGAIVWFIYLYYNFAGYMDIVIGLGRLAGFRLPENFNKPFAANSFLEFWGRWHMTLSFWFRTYVFSPLYKRLLRKAPGAADWWTIVALFLTFALVGAWHGTTWAFVVCGVFLGIGAAVNVLYQQFFIRAFGRPRMKRVNASRIYSAACFGVTFIFMAIAIMPFWLEQGQYFAFLQRMTTQPAMLIPCFAVAAAAFILVFRWVAGITAPIVAAITARLVQRTGEDLAYGIAVAVTVNVLIIVTFANYSRLPSFVYQGF